VALGDNNNIWVAIAGVSNAVIAILGFIMYLMNRNRKDALAEKEQADREKQEAKNEVQRKDLLVIQREQASTEFFEQVKTVIAFIRAGQQKLELAYADKCVELSNAQVEIARLKQELATRNGTNVTQLH
jgi:hypothetical protein